MSVSKRVIISNCLTTDRLIGVYDEDFISCPICTNIYWKPIACQTCENSFCLNCIRIWINDKPNQCPFNCYFKERKSPGILLKLLSKLKLTCENQLIGCDCIISYEALEKHQLQECLFRTIQCEDCSKQMIFKDLQIHQEESCESKSINCLKCSMIYYKKEGHTQLQCLHQQISIIEQKINQSDQPLSTTINNFKKLTTLYNKLLSDEDYANKIQLKNSEENSIPSAPPEESLPIPSAPPCEESSTETLRLSTVNFNLIRQTKSEGDHIPNGYAGFNWENGYYINEEYVKKHYQLKGFLNSFTNQIKCVAFNGKGNSLSIYLPNSSNKFNLHSFQALSIYHENFRISITGYRLNIPILTKNILLTNQISKLFQIDFQQIDKITFTPAGIDFYTLKPQTFALVYLNFIL